jgi:hypothetical protein
MMRLVLLLIWGLITGEWATAADRPALEPPTIPVGLDAYRQWERWPYQRIGVRAYMRSTYDRTGGNESADASHFLYQESNTFNVSLDIEGAGELVFARYNHWHGSPWHYEVDGRDHIVEESSSADPTRPASGSVFLPTELFPNPLTWTWSMTKGADLMWVPIAFERSFRMAYTRTRYGTGYYIYHQYVPGAKLSQPIRAWDAQGAPDSAVLALLRRSGTDIAPKDGVTRISGSVGLPRNATVTLAKITNAPAMIRAFELSVPTNQAVDFSRAFLRLTWDSRSQPSIEAPVALFFGTGTFYNRGGREYLVKAFPVHVRYEGERVRMGCYFPMPFFREAKIELAGVGDRDFSEIEWSVRLQPFHDPPSQVGYFHASYRDHPKPELGQDLVLLDTRQAEGGGDWSGSFVGTSFIFTHRNELSTLEGDPRFFFDDSQSPQACGTGTEEWGGGGDYWGGQNMTLPFAGHPVGARNLKEAKSDEDKIHSAYRFLLADLMPFGRNAIIRLEHGGLNQSMEHYQTVAYWYGAPAASLVKTDELDVGDAASEQAHDYFSPDASKPCEITSRYEWGPDLYIVGAKGEVLYPAGFRSLAQPDPGVGAANLVVAYPAHKETGRTTTTRSEFTLKLAAQNVGVMLRRKLDYQFPNQRANVFIADASVSGRARSDLEWQPAGVWYVAGANTCVYSDPKGELGETLHHVETSNRRFRDDEFLVPRALTEGRSAIRVRVEFTPVRRPLFPGYPIPELAWSELRYDAYCFVVPDWSPDAR